MKSRRGLDRLSRVQQNLHGGRRWRTSPGGSITRLPIRRRHGGGGHRFVADEANGWLKPEKTRQRGKRGQGRGPWQPLSAPSSTLARVCIFPDLFPLPFPCARTLLGPRPVLPLQRSGLVDAPMWNLITSNARHGYFVLCLHCASRYWPTLSQPLSRYDLTCRKGRGRDEGKVWL